MQRDRAAGLCPIQDHDGAVRVRAPHDLGDGEHRSGGPQHVGEGDESDLARGELALKRGERPVIVATIADLHDTHVNAVPVTGGRQWTQQARVLVTGGERAIAWPPVQRPHGQADPLGR